MLEQLIPENSEVSSYFVFVSVMLSTVEPVFGMTPNCFILFSIFMSGDLLFLIDYLNLDKNLTFYTC